MNGVVDTNTEGVYRDMFGNRSNQLGSSPYIYLSWYGDNIKTIKAELLWGRRVDEMIQASHHVLLLELRNKEIDRVKEEAAVDDIGDYAKKAPPYPLFLFTKGEVISMAQSVYGTRVWYKISSVDKRETTTIFTMERL